MDRKENLRYLPILMRGRPLHSEIRYKPFFIIGSGRSGNTLLRAILETHPDLHIPPETYVLGQVITDYKTYSRLPWRVLLKIVLAEFEYYPEFSTFGISLRKLFNDLRETNPKDRNLAYILHHLYVYHAKSVKRKAKRWGDKTPLNTFHLNKIHSVFPDSLFIHIIRDGRDVVRSYMKSGRYKSIQASTDRWLRSVQKATKFGRQHPEQYMEIRYENLVKSPRKQIQLICNFLNLEYFDVMLRHHEMNLDLGDVAAHVHHANVNKAINTDSIGQWRQHFKADEIAELHERIGPLLDQLRYERE